MRTLTSTKIVRFVLAPLLSLWVAGGGCLIGCEGMIASAVAVPSSRPENHSARKGTIIAAGQACSSSESHSCCAKKTAAKPAVKRTTKSEIILATVGGSSSGMMKGCPLAVGKAALAAKIRDNDVAASPALPHSILPADNVLERTSQLSPSARLPNRGHTYLRCCVFLI